MNSEIVGDDRRDVEDELARVAGLHPLAVELERDVERVRVADLVGGDEERARAASSPPTSCPGSHWCVRYW